MGIENTSTIYVSKSINSIIEILINESSNLKGNVKISNFCLFVSQIMFIDD
jgi:hypothetical protein